MCQAQDSRRPHAPSACWPSAEAATAPESAVQSHQRQASQYEKNSLNRDKLRTLSLSSSTKISGFPSQRKCAYALSLTEIMLTYNIFLDHIMWSFIK